MKPITAITILPALTLTVLSLVAATMDTLETESHVSTMTNVTLELITATPMLHAQTTSDLSLALVTTVTLVTV